MRAAHPFISSDPFRIKHIEAAVTYVASHSAIWQSYSDGKYSLLPLVIRRRDCITLR